MAFLPKIGHQKAEARFRDHWVRLNGHEENVNFFLASAGQGILRPSASWRRHPYTESPD
jgi:hypothetical protein